MWGGGAEEAEAEAEAAAAAAADGPPGGGGGLSRSQSKAPPVPASLSAALARGPPGVAARRVPVSGVSTAAVFALGFGVFVKCQHRFGDEL